MQAWKFGRRSLENLTQVHSDLSDLCYATLPHSPYDFGVICGGRTTQEQAVMVQSGASFTMDSPHVIRPEPYREVSYAVDIMVYVNGKGTWDNKYYVPVLAVFMTKALALDIPIELGHWFVRSSGKRFYDSGHIQLKRSLYKW